MDDQEKARQIRLARSCARILSGLRPTTVAERIAGLGEVCDPDLMPDRYGDGPVAQLERRVARLLGKPAAAFFPSGTMAQQVALRCWAQRGGDGSVALHPMSHLEIHERHAYAQLSGLRAVWPTRAPRQASAEEIAVCEPFGTLMVELPLRDAGFVLPEWDELVASVTAARTRGARVHFDGARLWESTAALGHNLIEVCELADSVYVSFYKTLGGLSGAALAGPEDFIAAAAAWRHRYGGRIFEQWPAALAALAGLDQELPRVGSYVAHAKVVAAALAELPGAVVHPDPPHTHQFQLWLPYPASTVEQAALELAERDRVLFVRGWSQPAGPGRAMAEVTVAAPALEWSAADVRQVGADFLEVLVRAAG